MRAKKQEEMNARKGDKSQKQIVVEEIVKKKH